MSLPVLRPQDAAIVRDILSAVLPAHATVRVFGSRATGTAGRGSDLDLAIETGRPLIQAELAALADAFEDSDLPYTVDVVDLAPVAAAFRALIERDRVLFSINSDAAVCDRLRA